MRMGEPPTFAIVGVARASLGLAQSDLPAVATDIASVYVDVSGVDGLHAHCVASDIEISVGLTTHQWGQRDFCIRLPSGHQIAFGQPTDMRG